MAKVPLLFVLLTLITGCVSWLLASVFAEFLYSLSPVAPSLPQRGYERFKTTQFTDTWHSVFWVVQVCLSALTHSPMQVSDLHISKYHDFTRSSEFEDFLIDTIPLLESPITLVTGDLTDAKDESLVFSLQVCVERVWSYV